MTGSVPHLHCRERFFLKPTRPDDRLKRQVRALLPSVLVDQMAASLLGIVNTIMTSNVSKEAVAGVGQVDAIANIFVAVFNALAVGGTVMVAQAFGRGDRRAANHDATQAVFWGGLVSVLCGVSVFFLRAPLLQVLYPGVETSVFQSSMDYFFFTALSIPLSFIISQGGGAFRGVGDAKTPMRIGIVVNIVNILLGFVLIGGIGPLGGFGAYGAGITIFTSRLVGAVWMLIAMLRPLARVRLETGAGLRFDARAIRGCISIGLPAAFESAIFQAGRLTLQVAVSSMGTVMISASQVTNSASGIIVIPISAIVVAVVTLTGNYTGEGDPEGCRRALRYVTFIGCIYCAFAAILLCAWPQPLCWIYSRDPAMVSVSASALRVSGIGMIFYSHSFIYPAGFRGTGDVKAPLITSAITMWLFRVAFVYLVGLPLNLGVTGVWLGFILDWFARAVIFTFRERSGKWLRKVPSLQGSDSANSNKKV